LSKISCELNQALSTYMDAVSIVSIVMWASGYHYWMRSLHREEALAEGLSVEPSWRRPLRREPRVTLSVHVLSAKLIFETKKGAWATAAPTTWPPRPPPPGRRCRLPSPATAWPHRHLACPSPPPRLAVTATRPRHTSTHPTSADSRHLRRRTHIHT
jgi:hypothetical protein